MSIKEHCGPGLGIGVLASADAAGADWLRASAVLRPPTAPQVL